MTARGYGNSDGEPTEEGLKLDASAAMAHIEQRQDIHQGRVILFGRSLGGAVALYAARMHPTLVAGAFFLCALRACDSCVVRIDGFLLTIYPCTGIILENTFTSVSDMVDVVFPVLSYFKWAVLRIRWASVELIPTLRQPMLFISGAKDKLVPSWMVQRLHDAAAASSHREIFSVAEGTHNDTFQKAGPEYVRRLRAFLLRVCGESAIPPRTSQTTANSPSALVAAAMSSEAPIGYQPLVGDALGGEL